MMYEHYDDLANGKIGNVVDGELWDEEEDCIVINGTKYEVANEGIDVDEFLNNHGPVNLTLYRNEDDMCNDGVIEFKEKLYWLELLNDYVVYELQEMK